jgi:hypothetical protein
MMANLFFFTLALCLTLTALPAMAQTLNCTAEQQCRGDARTMCAASSLSILLMPRGQRTDLWIDRQGPYAARSASIADGGKTYTLDAFGAGYRLELSPDGRFAYHGNRGKVFTGHCKEAE